MKCMQESFQENTMLFPLGIYAVRLQKFIEMNSKTQSHPTLQAQVNSGSKV